MKIYGIRVFITDEQFSTPTDAEHLFSIVSDGKSVKYVVPSPMTSMFINRLGQPADLYAKAKKRGASKPEEFVQFVLNYAGGNYSITKLIPEGTYSDMKDALAGELKETSIAYGRRMKDEKILEEFGAF
jgi:hypothetical protein